MHACWWVGGWAGGRASSGTYLRCLDALACTMYNPIKIVAKMQESAMNNPFGASRGPAGRFVGFTVGCGGLTGRNVGRVEWLACVGVGCAGGEREGGEKGRKKKEEKDVNAH